MTISSTVRIAGPYIGSGAATVFPFAFKVFAAAEMQVAKLNTTSNVEIILVLNTDYTVQLNGDQNGTPGGTITLPAVLASGYNLTITSDIANLQPTDLTNQGGFYPEVITDALDRATIQIQQLDQNSRAIKIPLSDGVLDMTTPVVSARQGKYLAFDSLGLPVVSSGTGSDSALRTDLANATAVSAGSRLSGFRQVGTGATARTVDDKLKDTVSVKDFGAVGDGVADDTAAIQAALTAGNLIYIPAGTYKISSTLTPSTTSSIIGDGAASTVLNYTTNVNGFTFPQASIDRKQKVFCGFSMQTNSSATTAKYAFYFPGTNTANPTTTYCLSYVFRDIQINNTDNQFAGGFRLKDTFRTVIDNVGMSFGARGIYIEGQTVQTVINKFMLNVENPNIQFGSGDNDSCGLTSISSSSYYGSVTNVPEGLNVSNSFFVGCKKGFYGGALNCIINSNEFDLFTGGVGVELIFIGSSCVFKNNWVSPTFGNSNHGISGSVSGVVGILFTKISAGTEPFVIDSNTVFASTLANSLPNGGQAICVGTSGYSPFTDTKGGTISNNYITSGTTLLSRWTNGIQADRSKNIRILNNVTNVIGGNSCCSNNCIQITYQDFCTCVGNSCENGIIYFSCFVASGFGNISDNKCSTFTNGSGAPYVVGNWNLVRNLP